MADNRFRLDHQFSEVDLSGAGSWAMGAPRWCNFGGPNAGGLWLVESAVALGWGVGYPVTQGGAGGETVARARSGWKEGGAPDAITFPPNTAWLSVSRVDYDGDDGTYPSDAHTIAVVEDFGDGASFPIYQPLAILPGERLLGVVHTIRNDAGGPGVFFPSFEVSVHELTGEDAATEGGAGGGAGLVPLGPR